MHSNISKILEEFYNFFLVLLLNPSNDSYIKNTFSDLTNSNFVIHISYILNIILEVKHWFIFLNAYVKPDGLAPFVADPLDAPPLILIRVAKCQLTTAKLLDSNVIPEKYMRFYNLKQNKKIKYFLGMF